MECADWGGACWLLAKRGSHQGLEKKLAECDAQARQEMSGWL